MVEQFECDICISKSTEINHFVKFYIPKSYDHTFHYRLILYIFPNGNVPENVGYVSVMLDPHDIQYVNCSFNLTVSVIDAIGELRFRQSLGMDCDLEYPERDLKYPKYQLIGLDKFVKRE